tara:strand:+ start:173 stop:523 length:351 start_codon:yes stop_codon:yes gene_type:complete
MEWLSGLVFSDFEDFLNYKYNLLYVFLLFFLFEIRFLVGKEKIIKEFKSAIDEDKVNDSNEQADGLIIKYKGYLNEKSSYWPHAIMSWIFATLFMMILWNAIIHFTTFFCIGDKCF